MEIFRTVTLSVTVSEEVAEQVKKLLTAVTETGKFPQAVVESWDEVATLRATRKFQRLFPMGAVGVGRTEFPEGVEEE